MSGIRTSPSRNSAASENLDDNRESVVHSCPGGSKSSRQELCVLVAPGARGRQLPSGGTHRPLDYAPGVAAASTRECGGMSV
jgi:hypothetical protein